MDNFGFSKKRRFLKPSIIFPFVMILMVFFDGDLMVIITGITNSSVLKIIPNLALVIIFYLIRFNLVSTFRFWLWVAITGFVFDLYFTVNLGTYFIAFLLATYVMFYVDSLISNRLSNTIITFGAGILTFYSIVLLAGMLTSQVDVTLTQYLIFTVLPTLFFNVGIAYLFYKPASWASYLIV